MIEQQILLKTVEALSKLYRTTVSPGEIPLQNTRKEFEGDITLVVFSFTKFSKKSPEKTGEDIGNYLLSQIPQIIKFNVIKGFLNLLLDESFWLDFLIDNANKPDYGYKHNPSPVLGQAEVSPVIIEYSSPNTNKPLHLGHIRNNLLGYSLSEILKANGERVIKVNLVNDRGIHICKSMLAWKKWGDGETPESSGMKGDHLVGKYYVLFDRYYKAQIEELIGSGFPFEVAEKNAPLIVEAQDMLFKWEKGDEEIMALWKMMNDWVYKGFEVTYKTLGVDFDKTYYESNTYLIGKDLVKEGLDNKIFYKKENGSVCVDLSAEGLDEKVLLRADGTSVYITQDLGTAQQRYDEFKPHKMIYVVGDEQNYHFDVLKRVLKKLGKPYAAPLFHLSYGMVALPEGKMKSREGTVVDADDLIDEMLQTAKKTTVELGKTDSFSDEEAENLYRIIGLGALKYFILKVDPQKNMLFNPQESIDFNGNTGPFIQYTYARIQSLLRKAELNNPEIKNQNSEFHIEQLNNSEFRKEQFNNSESKIQNSKSQKEQLNNSEFKIQNLEFLSEPSSLLALRSSLLAKEKTILKLLHGFPGIINEAAESYSPAIIANYVYELAKEYNQFYQEIPVLKAENPLTIAFRVQLSAFTGTVIKSSMSLLGIDVPDKM